MNVLIFVMTMLMLMALMTYARLNAYRSSQVFQTLFEHYMQRDERGYINVAAEKVYAATKGSTKGGKSSGQRVSASPRVSLGPLIKKTEKESAPQVYHHFAALLKSLMTTLYAKQPFFTEMQAQRPSFLDEIITALVRSVDELPSDKRPKKAADLANIRLGDEQLDDVFYKMLRGAPYNEVYNAESTSITPSPEQAQGDEDQSDASVIEKEGEEYKSPKGYFSLLDFITLQPVNKVRVFLAPTEVLKAIFIHDDIVNDIIRKRKELYHQALVTDSEGVKSLSASFKNEFDNREDPAVGSDILDFTVTKTNPSR